MIRTVVWVETVALVALAWSLARRAYPASPRPGLRLLAIAGLLAAQAAVLDGFALGLAPATWRAGSGTLPGLVWATQAARGALLLAAFRLWLGLSSDALQGRWRRVLLAAALLAQGFGGGALPLMGLVALVWLASRPAWSRELSGWSRFLALVLGAPLLLVIVVWPYALVRDGQLSVQFAALSQEWQTRLVGGALPPRLQAELALARPLDRLVQALGDLFRAQLLVVVARALTMPLRLRGMSLKRRFLVNYIFVRNIPSVLAFLTLVVVAYVGFGIHKTGRVRADLERTLARADAVGAALLDDPRLAAGGSGAAARLEAAREWLGPQGARAHLVLRRGAPPAGGDSLRAGAAEPVQAASRATAPSVLALALPPTRDGRLQGVVEDGAALYLASRRIAGEPAPGRALEVYIPLDSSFVASLAQRVGGRVVMTLDRGVSVRHVGREQGLSFVPDTSGKARIRVSSGGGADRRRREVFLGRSYLPLGDWRGGWHSGITGAVAVELRTTGALLLRDLRDVPGWLYSNVVMVALLLGLTMLIGIAESVAVRSGRGIVKSIEEEVADLRQAAARLGAGDLAHRVPVRGRDELSALAGSFNEMAASLERQRAELIEKERIEEDLEVARQIQRRFMPQQPPRVAGLDVAGISVPSLEVGGDLFHYVELPGGRLGIALGDVSGKSVPAALIMSNVMSALRAEALHETELEKSLERINRLLVEQIEPGRFVTLFYAVADPAARLLRYTSAGHNPVLQVTAAGETRWLREGGVPLGVLPAATYPSARAGLEPGDVVMAYSDGVTEAESGDRDAALFGEERLAATVRGLRAQPAEAIVQGVLAAVASFAAGRPQSDDLTLVVVRCSSAARGG